MTVEKQRRNTKKRAEIRGVLLGTPEFTSAQALFARLKGTGSSVGLATVYRTLNDMAESGVVDVVHTETGEQLYRLCGTAHHHHLICTSCGKTIEVQAPLEAWVQSVAQENGFTNVHHVLDVYGVCADCR